MLDQVTDINHATLCKIAREHTMPEYVQEADLLTDKEASALPGMAFADTIRRKYPVCSKPDTWLSVAYFHKTAETDRVVASNLEKATAFWKITEDELKQAQVANMPKEAADGVVIKYTDGTNLQWTTEIHNESDFEKVASDLVDHPEKYTYMIRKNLAAQLLKTAADKGWKLDEAWTGLFEKTAGQHVVLVDALLQEINTRRLTWRNREPELESRMNKLACEVRRLTDELVPMDVMEKAASITDVVDRLVGCHYKPMERTITSIPKNKWDMFQKTAVYINGMPVNKNMVDARDADLRDYLHNVGVMKTANENMTEVLENLPSKHVAFVMRILNHGKPC